jgi:RNA polymerase sigma factor (sigma-70 family)
MADAHLGTVVRQLRKLADAESVQSPTDAELLTRFVEERDEGAFAALVGRHGPLVWQVCRGTLGHDQDAEDAFQATFLVLAGSSRSLRPLHSLAGWLYGVARRTALKARTARARRWVREQRQEHRTPEQPPVEAGLRELQAILLEEVAGLPEKYRLPFVLCHLEGKSRAEAAGELGWKEGTLSARLTQAKRELERRLGRRGVALPAALTAAALTPEAAVPASLVTATTEGARLFVAGQPAGMVSPHVLELTEAVMKTTLLGKLKMSLLVLLAAVLLAAGAGIAAQRVQTELPAGPREAPDRPVQAADLIRQVRRSQAWIHDVKSLSLRLVGTHKDPVKDHEVPETYEIRFDGSRLGRSFTRDGLNQEARFWDGKRGVIRYKTPGTGRETFVLFPNACDIGDAVLDNIYWLWGEPHTFWWSRPITDPEQRKRNQEYHGVPEDFVVTGRAVYRGIPCHVLHKKGWQFVRLYVGEKTGLLHGRMENALRGNPEADRFAVKLGAQHGKEVKGFDELMDWAYARDKDLGCELYLAVRNHCFPSDRAGWESYLLDYQEVQPGRWFPMTQGYVMCTFRSTFANPIVESIHELKVAEVKLDQPLSDALFAPPTMPEGVEVIDRTVEPALSYKFKKDRTAADWDQLLTEARKQRQKEEKEQAARDELIGTLAPPLPREGWVNGPARSWADLKGKSVLLFFWSEGCGACRGHLPHLLKKDKDSDTSTFLVIGVHTPDSTKEEIEKALKKVGADGLACIDPLDEKEGYGRLFTHFRLTGLPSAVLVDGEGKVEALSVGDPMGVFRKKEQRRSP